MKKLGYMIKEKKSYKKGNIVFNEHPVTYQN